MNSTPAISVGYVLWIVSLLFSGLAGAADLDEFKLKRQEVFEFTEKPKVTRAGDTITITFASKHSCDATVAVENADRKIVRHLASGVLGKNAPPPFQKDSLKQTIVWDGKNDQSEYIDDKNSVTVRVSLGLKPQFEKTLFWHPGKRNSTPPRDWGIGSPVLTVAVPEGILTYEGGQGAGEQVRLFDHNGDYLRTVFPFPREKLVAGEVRGLVSRRFPQDGATLPLKRGTHQYFLLTTGGGRDWNPQSEFAGTGGVADMASRAGRIALVGIRLNRLAIDGSTAGLDLTGPIVSVDDQPALPAPLYRQPYQVALSPDAKWAYVTGFNRNVPWGRWEVPGFYHAVLRMPLGAAPDAKPALFAGEMTKSGNDNQHFVMPVGVDCDEKGRVYVADYGNDRIQVYSPEGQHLKTIPFKKPAKVRVHRKTGDLWVFSWFIRTNIAEDIGLQWDRPTPITLTHLGPFDNPAVQEAWPLPSWQSAARSDVSAEIDSWSDKPRVWLNPGPLTPDGYWTDACLHLYEIQGRKLVLLRHLGDEAAKAIAFMRHTRHMKQRLYFDPKNENLYVGEQFHPWPFHVTSMIDIPRINPNTGKVDVVRLPFDSEDMAFDMNGCVYLRTADALVRYDALTWREVPFDYGEELRAVSANGLPHSAGRVISAVTFAGVLGLSTGQMGGMNVSPKRHLIVTVANPDALPDQKTESDVHGKVSGIRKYVPPVYPGRSRPWEVHVFDKHGKVLYADAVPGIGRMAGIAMDRNDDIYVMLAGVGRVGTEPYFNPASCSWIKLKPGTKVLSTSAVIPLPEGTRPNRPPDCTNVDTCGSVWIDGAYWIRGGVGIDAKRIKCHCASQSRPALDYFARSFLPEVDRYDVLVIDGNNNEICRIGRYGNVDDGAPLVKDGGPPNPRSIGGDEVAIMHGQMLAVHTHHRLFISDLGNARILSVKLGYHAEEKVALKDVKDQKL